MSRAPGNHNPQKRKVRNCFVLTGGAGGRNVKRGGQGSGLSKRLGARNEATTSLRKQAILSKRRCTDEAGVLGQDQLTREAVVAIVEACKKSTGPGAAGPSSDLGELRKVLSHQDDVVIEYAVGAGAVDALLAVLEGTCAENFLEAVWCITNIASGSSEHTELTLATTPCLIQLMESQDPALQEQCIWAMGNMAGDNAAFRDQVRANGAVLPIVRKLQAGNAPSVRRIAAWSLSNLARGPDPKLQEFFTAGAGEALLGALSEQDVPEDLAMEVAWVLTFLTHGQEEFNAFIAAGPALPILIRLLQTGSPQLQVPALRTIGNLVCGTEQVTDAVIAQPDVLAMLKALLGAENRGLRKESAWTISNIAAGTPSQRDAVVNSGAVPDLVQTLQTAHFDVRKEAAFALFHLLHDERLGGAILTRELATEFVGLLRAPDPQVVEMSLTIVERVLATLEGAQRLVEEADGIDALEQLVYSNAANAEMAARASFLVDKYYGEDAEPY